MEACSALDGASLADIVPYLAELVDWLADMNWPVAKPVMEKLETVGGALSPVLINVLKGDDHQHKYYLLSGLLLRCRPEVREACMSEVVRIINDPSDLEKQEEVDLVAQDVLVLYSHE